MYANAVRGYQKASVTTVDRLRLVILCYEGCIANAARAQDEMRKGNIAEKGLYLSKATAIVSELLNSLDKDKGGEIAERLEGLYRYVLHAMSTANIKNEPGMLNAPIDVLKELKDGWVTLSQQQNAPPAPTG